MAAVDDLSFDPWDPAFVSDPYPAYAELRERGRVIYFEPTRQWLVPRHADVSALLRDRRLGRTYQHRFTHEDFGRTQPPPEHEPFHTLNDHGMLDLEPPDHTRIRRLVSKAFTPRTVERLKPYVRRLAGELVDRLVREGGGDLLHDVAEPLPVAVIAEMLGHPGGGPGAAAALVGGHLRDVRAEPVGGDRGEGRAGLASSSPTTCGS